MAVAYSVLGQQGAVKKTHDEIESVVEENQQVRGFAVEDCQDEIESVA